MRLDVQGWVFLFFNLTYRSNLLTISSFYIIGDRILRALENLLEHQRNQAAEMGIIRARLGQVDGNDEDDPDILEIELPVSTEASFDKLEELLRTRPAAVTAFVRIFLA